MDLQRTMLQLYVREADKALEFYKKAFNAKEQGSVYRNEDDGKIDHCEINVYGQSIALSESRHKESNAGNIMQFCLHFKENNEAVVRKIYEVLKEGALPHKPPHDTGYSKCGFDLIDKFGVNWCVYTC